MADKQPLVRDGSLQQDRGYWVVRARVYDPVRRKYKHRSKSTGIKTKEHRKREAERMKPDILANWEAEAQAALCPIPDDPLFGDYIWKYLERAAKEVKETTVKSYHDYARVHVLPALGDKRVREMRPRHLQEFLDDNLLREKGLTVSSAKKIFTVINGALDEAVLSDVIAVNFASSVRYPKAEKRKGNAYSPEEFGVLLRAAQEAGEPLYAAIVLGGCYGLRRSEALGLRWSDIDLEAKTLSVRNTVTQNGTLRVEEEKTKTKASRRTITLLEETIPYFRKLKQMQAESGLTLDKVCVWPDGREVRGDYLTRAMPKLAKSVGLPELRYHDLRHTAASMLVRVATPKQVQEFLGHEDISTTLNIYVHQNEKDRKKTSELMDEILGAVIRGRVSA